MYKLALVGRPNVGKSALFNCICKKRIAIVDEAEGVTRDRLYAEAEWRGRPFLVIDTGGLDSQGRDPLNGAIRAQSEQAIAEADSVILVVDGRVGMTRGDQEVVRALHKSGKRITVAVNKIDSLHQRERVHEFYHLGVSQILPVSALHGYQIAELLELAWEGFSFEEEEAKEEEIALAIVGRPNVGKSTLINALLQEPRCVVGPEAGTTRDSIDIPFRMGARAYRLIDTAGIRRKRGEHDPVDKFAALRTEAAIRRAHLILLLVNASEGITSQEKKIIAQIEEAGKTCMIGMNKWDLVHGFRMEHCLKALHEECAFLKHTPFLCLSATTGRNVDKLFPTLEEIYDQAKVRISTHQLNTFLIKAMQLNPPPVVQGKRLRIYYMTQVDVQPPRFVLFVNHPSLMSESYQRYLINQFRSHYPFPGTPLQIHIRGKQPSPRGGGGG